MTSLFFLSRFTACLSSRVPAFVLNFKVAMCLCAGNNRDSATGLTFVLSTGVEFRFNHKRSGNIDRRVLQSCFFTYFSNWVPPSKATKCFWVFEIQNRHISAGFETEKNVHHPLRLLLKDLLYIYVVHCCTLQLPPVEAKTTIHKASLVCPTQQVCCDWLHCLPVSCLEPRALPHFLVS